MEESVVARVRQNQQTIPTGSNRLCCCSLRHLCRRSHDQQERPGTPGAKEHLYRSSAAECGGSPWAAPIHHNNAIRTQSVVRQVWVHVLLVATFLSFTDVQETLVESHGHPIGSF